MGKHDKNSVDRMVLTQAHAVLVLEVQLTDLVCNVTYFEHSKLTQQHFSLLSTQLREDYHKHNA